jgi:hypothetical protein
MLHCPQCGVEYRHGYTSCADCHVFLVHQPLPEVRPEALPEPGDPNLDPFCSFWRGDDAQICAELCSILDEAGIPHRTVHRADHLFHFPTEIPHELGVPASFYEKAELAVKEAFGIEEASGEGAVPLLPAPYVPSREFSGPVPYNPQNWSPEDATVEVWAGDRPALQEFIETSLREHEILTRWQWSDGKWTAFVLPQDDERAHKLIREILNSSPSSP